jgi:hypothetical protein
MKKKATWQRYLLLIVVVVSLVAWGLAAKSLYQYYRRAMTVNQELVQLYRPSLNIQLIKQAAGILTP